MIKYSNVYSNKVIGALIYEITNAVKGMSPHQVHIQCYSHVLNLALTDTIGVAVASESLFSCLNDIAVFV